MAALPANAPSSQKIGTIALHRGHQSAAIEEIGGLVKADKALRPFADQPVFGESRTVAPRESREQIEIEARKLRHLAEPIVAIIERNPGAIGLRRRKYSILSAVVDCALRSFHLRNPHIASFGSASLPAARSSRRSISKDGFCLASRGHEASKTRLD
ncbi:hypothetical protein N2600_17325 [Rhizobium sp. WSM1274]|uniref:hypothetical protein n=1 Tax=Rhizobium sp. WSM1274 TaxID=3138254 RepID=UPI0021A3E0D1|nr:hypothetical protein [Rhizobium leguminosarum]UWU27128.1 hypothetical protein N2600_17325 [Rhizobium leguminosarum bv. viciae]